MEGGVEERAPLLEGWAAAGGRNRGRRNSVNLMRGEFMEKLPEKVKHGVDPENPFQIDVSRMKGMMDGQCQR